MSLRIIARNYYREVNTGRFIKILTLLIKMERKYPVKSPTSVPSTGRLLYLHLMNNISVPASANHNIWYKGMENQLQHPDKYPFRGGIPVGKEIELKTLSGKDISSEVSIERIDEGQIYKFDGSEGPVFVSDLSENASKELNIPENADPGDKVYNPNFKDYDDLDPYTKASNELAVLSFAKSVSSYYGGLVS